MGLWLKEVRRLLQQYEAELVVLALDRTILNAGKSLRYTMSILQRWDGQGLRTAEQIRVADEEVRTEEVQQTQKSLRKYSFLFNPKARENQKRQNLKCLTEEHERRLKEF